MESNGNKWKQMESNGIKWNQMETNGNATNQQIDKYLTFIRKNYIYSQ